MKKLIAITLVVCALLGCLLPLASALPQGGPISLRLNSNIAGCTHKDAEKLIEIRSPQVTYYQANGCPVSIATCVGGGEYAHMDAGRTYTITYTLTAAEGYTLPEELADGDVAFDCGKGVKVVYCKIEEMQDPASAPGENARTRVLRIVANVVVDGNAMQRIIGWIRDILLKIRSWQRY